MEREAEAAKEGLALGGWQPCEDIINSTTRSTTTTTITTVGTGLSSKYNNGAKFLVCEEEVSGESSFGSFALKNGGANFDDSKTTPEHVILDLTATASAIQGAAEINPEDEDHFKTDLYLDTVSTKPENYNFYCPNCKACIEKVLIRNEEDMRCPTCLECVKFIGGWVLQKITREKPEDPVSPRPTPPRTNPEPNVVILVGDSSKQKRLPPSLPPPKSPIKWEILKSTVYGGLIESITSLSVVTSAASSAAATLTIVALALANLIGGLFVIGHNLRELKNDQSRVVSNQEGEQADRYEEILGQKTNFIIHASVAVLSFLVFGLVPPLVYGFSFYESDNEYLKLAAVAAASLSCITVLAIAKAAIHNPPVSKYITTVLHYLAIGVGASGISYLAGYLLGKLIEKLGWFQSTAAVSLPLPEMSSVKHTWGSY
ncbi:membrane protein of ER body 1-like isoform X3 [Alnus glutinosa]|uniref:membrane protein of ER body 1-like isoform X3 n=1 Tax=Alnus glutinosa TaxID=3517 RepID=UPI002D77E390|nr:membrane protein of ER body 1-like isoform X3 [Alnus glutinosa]